MYALIMKVSDTFWFTCCSHQSLL